MKNLDLTNPDDKDAIKEVLRQGKESQFWDIICQRLKTSIDAIQSQLDSEEGVNLIAEEYKIRHEVLRKQKIDRRDILDMPQELLLELDNPEFFAHNREEEVYEEPKDFEDK